MLKPWDVRYAFCSAGLSWAVVKPLPGTAIWGVRRDIPMGGRRRRTGALVVAAGGASSLRSGRGTEDFDGVTGTTHCLQSRLLIKRYEVTVVMH